MVKVHINTRPDPQYLPLFITPASPPMKVTGHPVPESIPFEKQGDHHTLRPPPNMSPALEPNGLGNTTRDNQHELPAALRVGQDIPNHWTSNASTSLQVAPSDLTPRSSSESQRSATFTPQAQHSTTTAYQMTNNPYHRMNTREPDLSLPAPVRAGNSTAVWADEPNNVSGGPYGFHNQYIAPLEPSLSRPLEGPPEKPPFAEPWVDFKVPPEEQALFAAEGTDKHQAEVQRTADVWKNEHSRQVADEAEQQELEAQAFQGRRKEDLLDWSDAPEKALPLLPTVGGSSAVEEKAPTALLKDSVETSEITSSPFQSLGKGADGQKDNAVAPSAAAATTTDSAMSNINSNNVDTATSPAAGIQSQQAAAKQQRNEIYQIRHVNWFDASSPVNPRRSPIMVQNANGPCPLLALVNALVLSTPADITTALVETLRVREQVSLGLLLDAVIDELMSGRRGDAAQNLPDVSELYAFLINLHTGMNVNPRFVEPPSAPTHLLDDPIDGPPDHQAELRKAGGFEDTPHMRLYSTFAVPLVHGWLPRKNHPVCDALRRCAETYEDAQSLLFAEEDLENKLEGEGLTPAEQRLLEDIATVKHFLTTSPTQLTEYGLDTIADSLKPGSVAILFRNDHFSTLYKQPRSGRIFTLVTDMGYAGHDEVVWESLVDIGGEGSEFFSGDFRPVGNNVANNRRSGGTSSAPNDGSWTTVSRHNGRRGSKSSLSPRGGNGPNESTSVTNAFSQLSFADGTDSVMPPGTTEQEDHDLALAMQLQEEEEDRHRQESTARRRRENELSQTYLDSASRSNQRSSRPEVPPRGGGARRAPPRNQTRVEDAPPPTYEQAAKGPAYQPSSGNSPHTGPSRPNIATTGAQGNRPTRQTSAYSQTNTALTNANRPRPAGRQPQAQKDKDCVVM